MKKTLIRTSLVLLLVMGMAANASALPMTGGISFSGDYAVDTGNVLTATAFTSFSNVVIESGSGTWLSVTQNTPATFTAFTFSPAADVDPLWSFTFGGVTYSFAALGSTINSFATSYPGNLAGVTVYGLGTIEASAGFDDTPGSFLITANQSVTTFSFSASSATLVPEPLTLILLGSGLLGLFGFRRKLS
jgi:hypothetical protein